MDTIKLYAGLVWEELTSLFGWDWTGGHSHD